MPSEFYAVEEALRKAGARWGFSAERLAVALENGEIAMEAVLPDLKSELELETWRAFQRNDGEDNANEK